MENIEISTDYIKLDSFLKFAGVAQSGADAKNLILEGKVKVNRQVCLARGKKLSGGDLISVGNRDCKVVKIENL